MEEVAEGGGHLILLLPGALCTLKKSRFKTRAQKRKKWPASKPQAQLSIVARKTFTLLQRK